MIEWLVSQKELLDVLARLVVLLGVPTGLYQYVVVKRKEERDRQLGTYNALDEKFLTYQELCFKNPQLDIFDVEDLRPTTPSDEGKKKELIAFTMLMSIFERAYLMYADQSDSTRQLQWKGWREYMEDFVKRKNFQNAWELSGQMFDTRFEMFMDRLVKEASPAD